ncbi:MAG: type II secretion system protein GspJ [Sphingomonas sp. 28-62-20]|uniref:type II secretion system minor pseudopilin GspJ n=1 Tax=Sphingomonas sp. 28-62-20 TaxID=1970433 RepID=UPI000BCF9152|nr:MAG: type II secretion system protein GspJ [Sphingomonas sp. 28-62-20]
MIRRNTGNGSRSVKRSAENGFTLIEMMIALLIFGLLAAAGVALLSFSVRAQGVTAAKLDDIAAIGRLSSALSADLAQASPRQTRDEGGIAIPAFQGGSGSAGTPMLQLVRNGWTNLDDAPRAGLQKVEYRVENNTLLRVAYPMLDGAAALPPATLLGSVASVGLRYRIGGAWSDRWTAEPGMTLPEAMEMLVTRSDGTRFRSVYLVGTGYNKPAPKGGINGPG